MSGKSNVPVTQSDEVESGLPTRPESDQPGQNVSAEIGTKNFFDGIPEEKHLSDGSSVSDQNNRLHNNPNDTTDRDPTRSTDKPISGKIQK